MSTAYARPSSKCCNAALILLLFFLLCFIDIAFFYKSRVCCNLVSSKSISIIFSTASLRYVDCFLRQKAIAHLIDDSIVQA